MEQNLHVGFDARMYGVSHAGIGRYIENLVQELLKSPIIGKLTLFLPRALVSSLSMPPHVQKISADIRHYTLEEQISFLRLLSRYPLDLMHFPHFNVPLLYNRPFVVTIHDILWHRVRGPAVTTLNPLMYYVKYFGYRQVVGHAVQRSRGIIVPSNFVAADLKQEYPLLQGAKTRVIYEGVSPFPRELTAHPLPQEPYLLYIGSAYPHKNIPVIFPVLKQTGLKLVIVSSRSIFLDRLKQTARSAGVIDRVSFLGFQPDGVMASFLQHALALVHPSLSEGFGLTGLEAMSQDCPVIAARSSCLPEIYADAALYFSPEDPQDLAQKINQLTHEPGLRATVIAKGRARANQFNWSTTASQTIKLYHQICQKLR